jgi:hypothetical protein
VQIIDAYVPSASVLPLYGMQVIESMVMAIGAFNASKASGHPMHHPEISNL